ncbi:MAG: aminotransferase class V-fold PLP-dependent enzyme, partial [Nitrospirota bacterium]
MRRIYMDHMAATPIHPEVLEAMLPYLKEDFGNPLSLHSFGGAPKRGLDEAREKVALLIGADPKEIIFVSSGTEANNLAIKGVAFAHQKKGKHIISSQIEHHSVVHSLKSLEKAG